MFGLIDSNNFITYFLDYFSMQSRFLIYSIYLAAKLWIYRIIKEKKKKTEQISI